MKTLRPILPSSRASSWLLAMALVLASSAAFGSPSNKWRIACDGSTTAGGDLELAITPQGGTTQSIVVVIPPRTSENTAAGLVRKALIASIGKKAYKIETDDGEDVLVKAKGGTGDFDLVVVRNTAVGLEFKLRKE